MSPYDLSILFRRRQSGRLGRNPTHPFPTSPSFKSFVIEAQLRFAERGMVVIGIAGGVASGKSLVAEQFERLGAVRLDADRAGHEVLAQTQVKQSLQRRWGDDIFAPDGSVDRAAVAQIVFGDAPEAAEELAFLEQVTHPLIGEIIRRRIDELEQSGACPAVVLDAALMLEAGWDKVCDAIVFVDAAHEIRLARALGRNWTRQQFEAREGAQAALDEKRRRADWVIDNSGSQEKTFEQVSRIWSELLKASS